ncbi:MAG: hypothetical protein IKN34_09685 [Treponema sp.]|nr:hypothetical protein [Treponema sp.]
MKSTLKKFSAVLFIFSFAVLCANAVQVSKFDFTGTTKTERVSITINEKDQIMEYLTPSRNNKYQILDYDYQDDKNTGTKVFSATVLDSVYNTAYTVILYFNGTYSDMRIGRKRITFRYVDDFRIVQ